MMIELARRVIQCYEDFDGFVDWLKMHEKAGSLKNVEIDRERKVVSIGGIINTGFSLDHIDPINLLVILGLAFFRAILALYARCKTSFQARKEMVEKSNKEKEGEEE